MTAWMVIQAIYILLMPIVIISLCKNDKLLQFLSLILSSYLLGLIIVHMMIPIHINLFGLISVMAIALAILYSLSHLNILHRFSTIVPSNLSFYIIQSSWNLDGLSVGFYILGILNPVRIGMRFEMNKLLIAMANIDKKMLKDIPGIYFVYALFVLISVIILRFSLESGQTMIGKEVKNKKGILEFEKVPYNIYITDDKQVLFH